MVITGRHLWLAKSYLQRPAMHVHFALTRGNDELDSYSILTTNGTMLSSYPVVGPYTTRMVKHYFFRSVIYCTSACRDCLLSLSGRVAKISNASC